MERNLREFAFENCRLQVDIEAMRAWYAAYGQVAGGCGCAYCRNFAAAIETVSPKSRAFFDDLGLDIRKPCEVMELGAGSHGRRLYEAFYHLVGTLETRSSARLEWEGGRAGFYEDCDLLPANFPRPCFQLNVDMELPWLLKEKEPEML